MLSVLLLTLWGCASSPAPPPPLPAPAPPPLSYVGSETCAECHPDAAKAWEGSHHALAMTPPGANAAGELSTAVDLNGDTLSVQWTGETLTLTSPDQSPQPVPWMLGISPLRQPMVQGADGRWQTPTVAFGEDGQPFPLQPGEFTPPGDELHWRSASYQADHMCLDCHTTGFEKSFSADGWASTWAEPAVGCEGCHGPASQHLHWVSQGAEGDDPHLHVLSGNPNGTWRINPETHIATPLSSPLAGGQVNACAGCHSRRDPLELSQVPPGPDPLTTHARPALVEPGLYTPDGRMVDEVFVWGSFLQSRMHEAGVVCTDCHDPHSNQVKGGPQSVCSTCHDPSHFDTPSHHHHDAPAPQCVDCHMPQRTYMERDHRRDHSFKVPRPQRNASLGLDSSCTQSCHEGQSNQWAAEATKAWGVSERHWDDDWVTAFATADQGGLEAAAKDTSLPAIIRASAASRFTAPISPTGLRALQGLANASDGLLRYGAMRGLGQAPDEVVRAMAWSALNDPEAAVRHEALWVLIDREQQPTSGSPKAAWDRTLKGVWKDTHLDGDRPQALGRSSLLHQQSGAFPSALLAAQQYTEVAPYSPTAWVNLADLYRMAGQQGDAVATLETGLSHHPDVAGLHHAYGLALVRLGRKPEALSSLKKATTLDPANPQFLYVFAVAASELAPRGVALEAWNQGIERFPNDPAFSQGQQALQGMP